MRKNYNYYVGYFELSGQSFQLDENGQYAPLPDPPGTYTIYLSETVVPEYTYQLENGNIRFIQMEMSSDASPISERRQRYHVVGACLCGRRM